MAKVTVFCSSSSEVSPIFLSEAEAVGEALARDGHTLIYGGSQTGMMGALGRGALQAQGQVVGVIPDLEFCRGLTLPGLSQEVTVANLPERKVWMLEQADAVVALPGGLGTLDEIFESLVLKSTGLWKKPFLFYNFLDFWDPLTEALTLMFEQRMISVPLLELYDVVQDRSELMSFLRRGILGAANSCGSASGR